MSVNFIKHIYRKRFNIAYIQIFIVQRILPLVFASSINAAPVLAWDEGGCSFSKNKEIKEVTAEQVENSIFSNK